MKKVLAVVLSVAMIISIFPIASCVQEENPQQIAGDLDFDNKVTTADALKALMFSIEKIMPRSKQIKAADVNADGNITAGDALLILQYSVNLIDHLDFGPNKKYFTISFDDGITQDARIMQIMSKYGIKGTFNVNTGLTGFHWDLSSVGITADHTRITEQDFRNGYYDGFEIASHTSMHPLLTSLRNSEVISQVKEDCRKISEWTGTIPTGMAYTGGGTDSYNDRVIDLITANTEIKYARTAVCTSSYDLPEKFMVWNPGFWSCQEDLLECAKEFEALDTQDGDKLFYVWGHGYEFDQYDMWDEFEELCSYMSKLDDVEFVTNGEFYYIFSDVIPSK